MSIGERIGQLADRLEAGGGSFRFDACFDMTLPEVELRHQVVVTLLAILELARLKAVRVLQSPTDDTLFITQVSDATLRSGAQRDDHVGRRRIRKPDRKPTTRRSMKKRKKTRSRPDADRRGGDAIPTSTRRATSTRPRTRAVTEAPAELLREAGRPDDWDGPTHEAAAAEMAALAASSAEAERRDSTRRRSCRRRPRPVAWRA